MLLEQLSNAAGASGNENAIRSLIIPAVKPNVDQVTVDTMGNVYAAKKGSGESGLTVMLAAHMDEVAFMITRITSAGLLKFEPVGGFDPRVLPGKTVRVGKNGVPGVIGVKAIHNLAPAERNKAPDIESLLIDIGATKKDEAAAKVSVGDYAVFDTCFGHLNSDPADDRAGVVKGKALDDRAGCAMMIELLRQAYPVNVVGAFTVQEEVGARGAQIAAHKIAPDLAIVLECTMADDLPVKDGVEIHYPRLGEGPVITLMDKTFIANRKLVQILEETATANHIPYQYKKPNLGGTDGGVIHKSRAGVPTVTVALPSRYIHGPVALIDLADFWRCVNLIAATLNALPRRWGAL